MGLQHQTFFTSLFLSRLADQILLFLVPLVVFQITGSVSWSGLAFFLEALPRYLAFPVCGALCDRIAPFRLLRVSQFYRAVVCVIGIAGYALLFSSVGWLIVLSAVTGVLTTQGLMAREVILPQVFKTQRFEKVLSYSQIADQLGMVLGPLAAALLLKFWSWEWVVLLAAGLFVAADFAMFLWKHIAQPVFDPPHPHQGPWFRPLQTAARHILRISGLKEAVLLAAAVNLVIGVTLATSAAMVTGLQGQTETYYALLQTAGAVATVVILFFIAHVTLSLNTLGLLSYSLVCVGGLLTSMGAHPWIYAVGFVVVIGFDKMFNIYIRSLRKRIIPMEDFGKTTGLIVMLNNLSQPFAGMLVALFASGADAGWVILALSLVMASVGGGVLVFGPGLAAAATRQT